MKDLDIGMRLSSYLCNLHNEWVWSHPELEDKSYITWWNEVYLKERRMTMNLQDLEHPAYAAGAVLKIDEKSINITKVGFAIRKNVGAIVFENNTETNAVLTFKNLEALEAFDNSLRDLRLNMMVQYDVI